MNLEQLNELDVEKIAEWPGLAKAVAMLILCGSIAGAWYYFDTKDQLRRLRAVEQAETDLRQAFESKQQRATNPQAYRRQLAAAEASFAAMLRRLPHRTEVAELLADISQTGLAAGLAFEHFQPTDEKREDFYAELPIRIRVTGRFHEFGRFVSGLAALPRIVTIHDIRIDVQPIEPGAFDAAAPLSLEATVKTYRYLDQETTE